MHPSALYGVVLITIAHLTHSVDGGELKCRQVLLKGQDSRRIKVNVDEIHCKGKCSADEICKQGCRDSNPIQNQHEDFLAFYDEPDPCVAAEDFDWDYVNSRSWKEDEYLYSCDCTIDIMLWRIHKSKVIDDGKSCECGNDDIKGRLSDPQLNFNILTEGLKDNVHCGRQ